MAEIQRWEYLEVVGRDSGDPQQARVLAHWATNGQTYQYANLLEALRHLGIDGWELVGVGPQSRDVLRLFLKRPILR